jgi:hypothetical protein
MGLRRVLARDYEIKQEIYEEFWYGDVSEMLFLRMYIRHRMITLRGILK